MLSMVQTQKAASAPKSLLSKKAKQREGKRKGIQYINQMDSDNTI